MYIYYVLLAELSRLTIRPIGDVFYHNKMLRRTSNTSTPLTLIYANLSSNPLVTSSFAASSKSKNVTRKLNLHTPRPFETSTDAGISIFVNAFHAESSWAPRDPQSAVLRVPYVRTTFNLTSIVF